MEAEGEEKAVGIVGGRQVGRRTDEGSLDCWDLDWRGLESDGRGWRLDDEDQG